MREKLITGINRRPWKRANKRALNTKRGGGVLRWAVIGFFAANGKSKVTVPQEIQNIVEQYQAELFH